MTTTKLTSLLRAVGCLVAGAVLLGGCFLPGGHSPQPEAPNFTVTQVSSTFACPASGDHFLCSGTLVVKYENLGQQSLTFDPGLTAWFYNLPESTEVNTGFTSTDCDQPLGPAGSGHSTCTATFDRPEGWDSPTDQFVGHAFAYINSVASTQELAFAVPAHP